MKTLILTALLTLASPLAFAETVQSEETNVEIARVVEVKNLVSKPGLEVNVAVLDQGGSTDMSPTQAIYLTLYSKGEMFSTDASFLITNAFGLKSVRRVEGGIYEVTVQDFEDRQGMVDVTYRIDAVKAVTDIQKVECGDEFDCDSSTHFKSTIEVTRR